MQFVPLGRTGIQVSNLCLGMMSFGNSQAWHLELEEARPIVERAIELGVNFFDTANVYSRGRSEEITGEILKEYRDDVVIATKVRFAMGDNILNRGLNRYHMILQMEASLDRLQMYFVELYQIHRWDYTVDIEYVMRSLNHLIDAGAALHIGASSMFGWELVKAQATAERLGLEKFATMQNHYNAIYREEEREVIPACMDMGMGIIPWSPLARGFLSGKYSDSSSSSVRSDSDPYVKGRYFKDNDFDVLEAIRSAAAENEISNAQMALAWVLSRPGITSPIIGVSKMEHLEQSVAVSDMQIDHDYFDRISEVYTVRPVTGHGYNQPDAMINKQDKK